MKNKVADDKKRSEKTLKKDVKISITYLLKEKCLKNTITRK